MKALIILLLFASCGNRSSSTKQQHQQHTKSKIRICGEQAMAMNCVDIYMNSELDEIIPPRWFYTQYCYERYLRCLR